MAFTLNDFLFTERSLDGLHAASDLSLIAVKTEAWLPLEAGDRYRKVGHIRVVLSQIQEAHVHMLPGFHTNAPKPDRRGAGERRGNEVYRFVQEPDRTGCSLVELDSDYLQVRVCCRDCVVELLS